MDTTLTRQCPYCTGEVQSSAQKCRFCGEWLVCRSCQSPIIDAGSFCSRCGAPIGKGPATTTLGMGSQPQYAGFWVRLAAFLLDGLILTIPVIITAITVVGPIAVVWLYTALMMSSAKQGTLGMMAMGLRVTDEYGHRVTFGRATARYFSSILSVMILYIGYLMLLWSGRKQTLHDQMAGTLILHGRGDLLTDWTSPAPVEAQQTLSLEDARRRAEMSLQLCDTLVAQVEGESIALELLPGDSPLRRQYALSLRLREEGARMLQLAHGTAGVTEADRKLNVAATELRAVRDALTESATQ